VATDAARGIDIDQLPVVINFDLPNIRNLRAPNWSELDVLEMVVLQSLCSKDEHTYWKDIQNLLKVDVKTVSDHQYHWHSGSPELPAGSQKKIQTEAEEHTNQENRSF
jgi:ATP-dependent RNA helicase RhlE